MTTQDVSAIVPARATHDFYYAVHKGLRLAHGKLLRQIATCDTGDRTAMAGLAAAIRHHVAMYRSHLEHEDAHLYPPLEARMPGGTLMQAHEHQGHERAFEELVTLADALASADGQADPAALRALYRAYCLFLAHDFEHMDGEEFILMPLMQVLFSDAELQAIEAEMLADISPDQAGWFMGVMLAAATKPERVAMIGEWKAAMPPEVFTGAMNGVLGGTWEDGDLSAFDRL